MYQILLVEDNQGQVRLTEEAFKECEKPIQLHVVYDGETAIDFLRKRGNFLESTRPNLILLDWNLPKKNGADVLKEIKADSDLKSIPVIVLTSSDRNQDVCQAYELQTSCFIKKPDNYEDFIRIVKDIESSWLDSAKPSKNLQQFNAVFPQPSSSKAHSNMDEISL